MLCHGCSVSQFPQLYEKIKNKYQLLPRTYVVGYPNEKGHNFFSRHMDYFISKTS